MSGYESEEDLARRHSRGEGIVLLVGGLAMLAGAAYVVFGGMQYVKLPAALAGLGTMSVMMGLGMVVAPWSAHPFDADRQGDADEWFRALPLGWKAWFFLSLVASFGVLIGLLMKLGRTR